MNNIVYALTFSSTNIACLSSLTVGRKDRKPPSGYTVGLGRSSQGLVRLLHSREPSQSGPDVIINKVLMEDIKKSIEG